MEQARRKSRDPVSGFTYFVNNIFSASFDEFVHGDYIDEVTERLHRKAWTMDITGRDHFKSTRLYARVMWAIFTEQTDEEGWYFSFNTDLASYHLAKIKQMIARNPFYSAWRDNKAQAETVMSYTSPGGATVTFNPAGLTGFKRGIHAKYIFVDDPLRDPENKVKPTIIQKINRIVTVELIPMVNRGGEFRIVGTPQTWEDFFFDEDLQKRFLFTSQDTIVSESKKISLWPEWKTYDDLMELREIMGEKQFNQEYRCQPAYAEESYITRSSLVECLDPELQNLPLEVHADLKQQIVWAGFDIGKKVHPSHLAVFTIKFEENLIWASQVFTKWMDGWDYSRQWDYLLQIDELFHLDKLRYDDTRGEFQAFTERTSPPSSFEPMSLNNKNQIAIASNMAAIVENQRVKFIDDQRQTNQILAVNSDLDAIEGPEGHGDSFWSVGLALYGAPPRRPRIRSL